MKLKEIDITATIKEVEKSLDEEKNVSSSLKGLIKLLILIIELMLPKLIKATSQTTSLPPSQDLNRDKETEDKTTTKSGKKSGGQPGHKGTTLKKVENPEEIIPVKIDRRTLPGGKKYKSAGFSSRQVFGFKVTRHVIEYRAEILKDEDGNQYEATYPEGVTAQTQYGASVHGLIALLSVDQLLPYERLTEVLKQMTTFDISEGTIKNCLNSGYQNSDPFETFIKEELGKALIINSDETGINVNKKLHWINTLVTEHLTLLVPHAKRGKEAMDYIGVLPNYKGYVVHDGFKAYFNGAFHFKNILCNAHHLRELNWVTLNTKSTWSSKLHEFLLLLNAGDLTAIESYRKKYFEILTIADLECPQDTRRKQSKERNLILRLKKYHIETLTFVEVAIVPFTNNLAERSFRMSKVQQKISGCFRSFEGAKNYCRIRSYTSTCEKNGIDQLEALTLLYQGRLNEVIERIRANLLEV